MAEHEIEVDIPARLVLHKDVTFTIWSDQQKLGELRISKGTIDWKPANKQTTIKKSWEQFDRLMQQSSI